ncbi:MAG: hypothetical protein ABFS42_04830 [Candidatus Krumholzibacteriota bacterium]
MTRSSHRFPAAVSLVALLLISSMPASAVTLTAGWTHADVGLKNKGDGFFVGVGNDIPLAGRILDASYALEYVQKVGSQPNFFSDPVTGFTVDDAEVTLHCVQPSIFLGAHVPDLGFVPRVYVGGSIVLKVKESWSAFPGRADREWGYKNTDIVGHAGVSLGVGPVTVDFRYTQGFTGQLLLDTTPLPGAAKAEVGPEGAHDPEIGAKLSHYQLGAGFSF